VVEGSACNCSYPMWKPTSTINLVIMIEMTRVQFPKYATTVMVDVDMSPMPLKVIGR